MSDSLSTTMILLVTLMVGFGLGTVFFYGLWRTLEKVTTSKSPVLWLLGSAISRISITLVGFYAVATFDSEGRLARLLICLLGFLLARFTVSKVIRAQSNALKTEVNRAP